MCTRLHAQCSLCKMLSQLAMQSPSGLQGPNWDLTWAQAQCMQGTSTWFSTEVPGLCHPSITDASMTSLRQQSTVGLMCLSLQLGSSWHNWVAQTRFLLKAYRKRCIALCPPRHHLTSTLLRRNLASQTTSLQSHGTKKLTSTKILNSQQTNKTRRLLKKLREPLPLLQPSQLVQANVVKLALCQGRWLTQCHNKISLAMQICTKWPCSHLWVRQIKTSSMTHTSSYRNA
jgi:hypothetical protein